MAGELGAEARVAIKELADRGVPGHEIARKLGGTEDPAKQTAWLMGATHCARAYFLGV